jgi:hypothetical protein
VSPDQYLAPGGADIAFLMRVYCVQRRLPALCFGMARALLRSGAGKARRMLEALIVGVIYIAIVMVVAWLLVVLVRLIPMPPPIAGVVPTVIWVIAAIICLVILLRVVAGGLPALP